MFTVVAKHKAAVYSHSIAQWGLTISCCLCHNLPCLPEDRLFLKTKFGFND